MTLKFRFDPRRTQTSFVRAFRAMVPSPGAIIPILNYHSLIRLYDMNPLIYVCAILLLDSGVKGDPEEIRESEFFKNLIEQQLRIPSKSKKHESLEKHRISLVLLEVYTYMILVNRARSEEELERIENKSEMELTF